MELDQVVSNSVAGAVTQVFATMLGLEIHNDPATDDFSPPPFVISGVCGNVSFAGRFTGAVYFMMTPELANIATRRIVGEGVTVEQNEENDVIGELTNMITGNLKSKMSDAGYNCQLSIPSILRGESIHVSGKGFGIWVAKKYSVPECKQDFTVRVLAKVTT